MYTYSVQTRVVFGTLFTDILFVNQSFVNKTLRTSITPEQVKNSTFIFPHCLVFIRFREYLFLRAFGPTRLKRFREVSYNRNSVYAESPQLSASIHVIESIRPFRGKLSGKKYPDTMFRMGVVFVS